MTRSVEIPDEAVEVAALAMFADEHCDKRQMLDVRGNWDARLNDEDQALYRSMARAALTAALPYLAPAGEQLDFDSVELRDTVGAEVFRGLHGNGTVHFDTDVENNAMRDWTNYFVKSTLRALKAVAPPAPAGDGGPQLREALAQLAEKWEGMDTPALSAPSNQDWAQGVDNGYDTAASELRGTLADHAAAVPQPADERPLRAALERYFSNGGPDTPIRTTWHEGVECWEAPASDIRELIEGSAVPQPVDRPLLDRDALAQVLITFGADVRLENAEPAVLLGRAVDAVMELAQPVDREALAIRLHSFNGYAIEAGESWAECTNKGAFFYQADAVLAVLASEQEQVRADG